MVKRILLFLAAPIVLLLLTLAINTLRHGSRQIEVAPAPTLALDENAAAQRLAAAVRLRTISFDGRDAASAGEFRKLHALLEKSFPRAHAVLKRETVNELSLLYTWPGSDPAAKPLSRSRAGRWWASCDRLRQSSPRWARFSASRFAYIAMAPRPACR